MTAQADELSDGTRSSLLGLGCELAALRVNVAQERFALANKTGIDAAQLRISGGQPGGGQWTDGDGGDAILIGAQDRGSASIRVGSKPSIQRLSKRRETTAARCGLAFSPGLFFPIMSR